MCLSCNQGDFISLELKNGQVVFRFGFEGKSEAKLTTNKTYNSNEWTKLNAGRKGLEGIKCFCLKIFILLYNY